MIHPSWEALAVILKTPRSKLRGMRSLLPVQKFLYRLMSKVPALLGIVRFM